MFLTKLAIKNLIRHKNRTLITSGIIAVAIFFYLIMDSMIGGMTVFSYQSIIDYEAGHLQIAMKQYWEDKDKLPLENLISLKTGIVSELSETDHFVAAAPELEFQAMLNNGSNELPVKGKGINIEDLFKTFTMDSLNIEGRMFEKGEYCAVMGKKLAETMNLEIGSYITLVVRDKNNTFNTIDVEICGLLSTINPNINRNIVFLSLDIVQTALNAEDEASKIVLRLDNKDIAPSIAPELEKDLNEAYQGIGVYPWNKLDAVTIATAKNAGKNIMVFIILMIAAIAIINTVILAVLERMEEIGVMKAMGLQENEIIYAFVAESAGIGIIGGIAGVIMGFAGVWLFTHVGVDWSKLANMDMAAFGIPVVGNLFGVWNPMAFINIFFFGIIVSLLSSILPARWAAKKDPVKSIYHR